MNDNDILYIASIAGDDQLTNAEKMKRLSEYHPDEIGQAMYSLRLAGNGSWADFIRDMNMDVDDLDLFDDLTTIWGGRGKDWDFNIYHALSSACGVK